MKKAISKPRGHLHRKDVDSGDSKNKQYASTTTGWILPNIRGGINYEKTSGIPFCVIKSYFLSPEEHSFDDRGRVCVGYEINRRHRFSYKKVCNLAWRD